MVVGLTIVISPLPKKDVVVNVLVVIFVAVEYWVVVNVVVPLVLLKVTAPDWVVVRVIVPPVEVATNVVVGEVVVSVVVPEADVLVPLVVVVCAVEYNVVL